MAAKKRKPKTVRRVKTQVEAAGLLNISAKTLYNWEHSIWFPESGKTSEGYDLDIIRKAQEIHGKKDSNLGEQNAEVTLRTKEAKLERELIAVRRETMELQEKEKLLIPRATVELHLATLLKELGDVFDKLPTQAGREAGKRNGPKVRAYLQSEFNKLRRRLQGEMTEAARKKDLEQDLYS